MTTWALINNGVVSELTTSDPTGRYHPTLVWVVCEPTVSIGWLYSGGVFTAPAAPSLADCKSQQISIVGAACAAAITGGFQSSALGKAYTYPSTQNDQANLNANVVSSLLPGLPANWTTLQICGDANGKWGYMPHTAAQIQQVGTDGKAAILGCLTKNAALQAQIAAATTVAAVQAINW